VRQRARRRSQPGDRRPRRDGLRDDPGDRDLPVPLGAPGSTAGYALAALYSKRRDYVEKVRASVAALVAERWLTAADGREIVESARRARVPR